MNNFKWEKLGLLIEPRKDISWLKTWTGASFARQIDDSSLYEIFLNGRDSKNRSEIGKIIIDINNPLEIIKIEKEPIFSYGEIGAFDENGVSYPWFFNWKSKRYMLYVGWMPTILKPFLNGLGLAVEDKNKFVRVSKAPILPRNNNDFLSIGSACVYTEKEKLRLYYTSFLKWGTKANDHKHYYVIKYAESVDGVNWNRNNHICINIIHDWEFSIARPSVIKIDNVYHMWFSYRGEKYLIGYAYSEDGINWIRNDDKAGIYPSKTGWDSEMVCYTHVFQANKDYFMLYCGNEYGKTGIGLAKLIK